MDGVYVELQCDICKKERFCRYIANPYTLEINDITRMQWLCDDCYQDCIDDI